jgi:hypothetical protein
MLVIAGPKRMIKWAYIMGQYVAKFRRMWAETVDVLQHEFDEAGVDIRVPRELPTRGSLRNQAAKAFGSVAAPLKETVDQVNEEVKAINTTAAGVKKTTSSSGTNGRATPNPITKRPPAATTGDGFGSWSSYDAKPGFGSWSGDNPAKTDDEE